MFISRIINHYIYIELYVAGRRRCMAVVQQCGQ